VLSLIYSRLALGGPVEAGAVVGFSIVISMVFLYATGCYRRDALLNRTAALSRIPTALAISGLVLFLYLHYLFPMIFPSARVFLSISRCITIILVGTGISLGAAIVSRNVVRVLLHNDVFRRRIMVVGTGQRARHIEDLSRAHGSLQEIHFVSEDVLTQSSVPGDGELTVPSIGELADRLDADEIIVAVDDRNRVALDSLLSCKARGVPVTEFNSFVERQTGRIELAWLELPWLIHTPGFQFRLIDDAVKRMMDIVFSLTALVISLPVLVVAMVAIRLDSPGPVIYRQLRVGKDGKTFEMLKFRSMCVGAEGMMEMLRDRNEATGPLFKIKRDPRITPVGRLLRRLSFDELPQLGNVIRGEMSLVGPRPPLPAEVKKYEEWQLGRLQARPGMTGLWQVSGRSEVPFNDMVRLDLHYVRNWSFGLDLEIMLRTIPAVVANRGAY